MIKMTMMAVRRARAARRPIPIPNAIAILFIHVRQTHAGRGAHEESATSMNRINRMSENRRSRTPTPLGKTARNEPHAHPLSRVQDAKNAKDACEPIGQGTRDWHGQVYVACGPEKESWRLCVLACAEKGRTTWR
jgi:hypothetical protein